MTKERNKILDLYVPIAQLFLSILFIFCGAKAYQFLAETIVSASLSLSLGLIGCFYMYLMWFLNHLYRALDEIFEYRKWKKSTEKKTKKK